MTRMPRVDADVRRWTALALVVLTVLPAATASAEARDAQLERPAPTSAPAAPAEREWAYDVALGPAVTYINEHSDSETYPSIGLRLGVGRWIAPEAVLSLRLAWTTKVFKPDGVDFDPSPTVFSGVVGPNLARWFGDRVWLAGTLGASFRHLVFPGEYPRESNGLGFAYGGSAGVVVYADGVDTVSVSFDATRALDGAATTTYALLVAYQRR